MRIYVERVMELLKQKHWQIKKKHMALVRACVEQKLYKGDLAISFSFLLNQGAIRMLQST